MIRKINLDAYTQKISGNYNSGDIVLVLCDATLAALSVTLPDVTGIKDVIFCIKKIDSTVNAVTISGLVGQDIDGSGSVVLSSQWDTETLISDKLNYYRLGII